MFGKKSTVFMVVLVGLLMIACTGNNPVEPLPAPDNGDAVDGPTDGGEGLPVDSAGDVSSGMMLVGSDMHGDWTLVSLNGHSLIDGSTITASFDGFQITGMACNNYFGSYTVEPDSLTFGDIGSTDMYCEETMDQEQEYFDALADINGWSVEGATLELYGETAYLVFEKVVPPSDVSLEGTSWVLDSFVFGGDAVSSLINGTTITMTITDGQISGNATCNTYSGSVEIDGAGITVGQLIMTEMACETGMDQEAQYLEFLGAVSTWEIQGNTLTLKADNGNALIFKVQQ